MAEDKPLNIRIDPDALTIPDMALIMSIDDTTETKAVFVPLSNMLERVVVGGVAHIPARRWKEVFAEVVRQWGEVANPKAPPAG